MKRIKASLTVFLLFLGAFAGYKKFYEKNFVDKVGFIFRDFNLKKASDLDMRDFNVRNYTGEREGQHLKLQVFSKITKEAATKLLLAEAAQVMGSFRDDKVAYFGSITEKESCEHRPAPSISTAEDGLRVKINLFTDQRFVYGFCDPDLSRYRALFLHFYCEPQKAMLSLKLYVEKDLKSDTLDKYGEISCSEFM